MLPILPTTMTMTMTMTIGTTKKSLRRKPTATAASCATVMMAATTRRESPSSRRRSIWRTRPPAWSPIIRKKDAKTIARGGGSGTFTGSVPTPSGEHLDRSSSTNPPSSWSSSPLPPRSVWSWSIHTPSKWETSATKPSACSSSWSTTDPRSPPTSWPFSSSDACTSRTPRESTRSSLCCPSCWWRSCSRGRRRTWRASSTPSRPRN
mmetsp:Transcript_1845/g.4860  ORF Transcript_1845/g.4860 Transcript_1845/m.4860 type:complete len:207 (-) Transcript_1845:2234-2854(-)